MRVRSIAGRLILFCAAASGAAGEQLLPSSTVLHTLSVKQDAAWSVAIPPGHVLDLSISDKKGMPGILTVRAADGIELAEADLGRRSVSARSLLVPPGAARIETRASNRSPVERVFELRTGELRTVSASDRVRLTAERLLGEGEKIHRTKNSGYRERALASYQQSLALWTKLDDARRRADTLAHIAYVRYELGEMNTARDTYRQALDLSTAAEDSPGIATALHGMALVAGDLGQHKEAEQRANQALEIRRQLNDLRGQAECLFVLLGPRVTSGRSDEGRALGAEALSLAQQSGDRMREADAHNFLGVIEFQLGNWKEATQHYSTALAIDREENNPVAAAQRLSNLGAVHYNRGEVRESIAYLQQAANIRKELASPNAYGNTLYNLAISYAELGEYDKALEGYSQALALFQKSRYTRGEGFVLRAMGNLKLSTGQDEKAEGYFRRAATKWRSISDRRGEVLALNSLGEIAARRREFSKAAELHRQALAVANEAGYQREEQQTLGYLADVSREMGDYRLSLEQASHGLDLARKVGDKLGEASALHQQGRALGRLRDNDRARRALEEALDLRAAAQARTAQLNTLYELASLDCDTGRLSQADERISRALELFEAVNATAGSQESRMRFAASHRRAFELAIHIAMQLHQDAKAFELSERGRARVLVDLLRQARLDIRAGVQPALLARERDIQELLDAKHDRFIRLLAAPHSKERETEARREIDALVDRYQAVQAEIRVNSPRYAALMQPNRISVAGAQGLLDSDTALLEYWLGEERSYAWVVTRTECRGFEMPPAAAIQALVRRAYQAVTARSRSETGGLELKQERLKAADAEWARASAELSRKILAPMLSAVRVRRLWIASDGPLEYLPFAALPMPTTAEPLVTRYEIARLPSASAAAAVREEITGRPPSRASVVVFADPVLRADDERVTLARAADARDPSRTADETELATLPRLHFSRQEAKAILALAPPGSARAALDFDANSSAAKSPEISHYRVIHFATHGLLNSRHPELSGIVLSMVDRKGRPQNGFLRLHEIYNLRLNADLVVLSACQTALGQEVRSEGLLGLTRGFMYAGSPQVLASLWSVRDRATAELMERFYDGLLKRRLNPAAALRAAQLRMLKEPQWANPYYWAAFVIQGG